MEKPLWERDSFFKVMIGDFQGGLRVPPCFHKHLRGDLHLKFLLRSRGGRRWTVMLRKEGKNLFFRAGWECFVADLAIKLGEFLLFVYDGNQGFDVKVYSITGCEKEDPAVFVKAEEEDAREISAQDPAKTEISTEIIRGLKRRHLVNGHVILQGSKMFKNKMALESALSFKSTRPFFIATYRSSREDHMTIPISFNRECKLEEMKTIILQDPKGRSWNVRIAHWTGRIALATGWTKFKEGNYLREGDVCIFEFFELVKAIHVHIFRANKSTVAVRRKAGMYKKCKVEASRAEKSLREDGRFAHICLNSKRHSLIIPKHVLEENYATDISKTILNDPSGRSWSVQLSQWMDGRIVLGHGWSEFWKANHIQQGNICVFELSGGIHRMDVQILRDG